MVARCKAAALLLVERGTLPEIAAALAREADAVHGDDGLRAREARRGAAPKEPESRFEDITDGEPAGSAARRRARRLGAAAAAAADEEEEEELEEKGRAARGPRAPGHRRRRTARRAAAALRGAISPRALALALT